MKKHIITFLKIFICYTIAGGILLTYRAWPNFEGHSHVPFSSFPSFLLFSPVIPLYIFEEDAKTILIFVISFIVLLTLFLWLPKQFKNKKF